MYIKKEVWHDDAVEKFRKYIGSGKTPEECGFPVLDRYEKQSAYLYGVSEEATKAYKCNQNIIRWNMQYSVMINIVILFIPIILFVFCKGDPLDLIGVLIALYTVFLVIYVVCWIICIGLSKKCGENKVLWINY